VIHKIVYKLFQRELTQMVWDETYKPDMMKGLKFALVCEGHKYYIYSNIFDIPIERMGRVQDLVIQLQRMVSREELDVFLENMENALNASVSGAAVKNLAQIGFLVGEMRKRKEMLIHPDIMMELAGAVLIREDQNPGEWNAEFEQKKVEAFRNAYKGKALYDFFVLAGLSQYFPNLEYLEEDWIIFWEMASSRLESMQELLKSELSAQNSTSTT
jgi:hypothetical protein